MTRNALLLCASLSFGAIGLQAQAGARFTLQDAAVATLHNYPALQAADAGVAEAEAALRQSSSARLPALFFSGFVTRFQKQMIVAPLHSFDFRGPPTFDQTLIQSEWTASYDLFDGGTRGARIAASRSGLRGTEALRNATQIDVLRRVASTYLDLLSAISIDTSAARQVAALASEVNRTTELFDAGRAARVQLLRAEAAVAAARAQRVTTLSQIERLANDLSRLTGVRIEPSRVAETMLRSDPFVGQSQPGVENNPNLRNLQEQVATAESTARAARGTRLPVLQIQSALVTFGSSSGDFSGEWRGGIAISYPLFTGGARGSAIERAEATAWRMREDLRTRELETRSLLDRASIAVREADSRILALEEALVHRTEVTRIELLALETGAGVQTDYLRAEAELFEARAALIDLRHKALIARINVAALVGDLSTEWLATYLESTP